MNPQDQLIEIAKLDGWQRSSSLDYECVDMNRSTNALKVFVKRIMYSRGNETCCEDDFNKYLHSRDAIVPVIEKQGSETLRAMYAWLSEQAFKFSGNPPELPVLIIAYSPPNQLCEALLRATGKWKE